MIVTELYITLIAVILLSVLAYWRPHPVSFMGLGAASLMLGLDWYDVYVTSTGMAISLVFIIMFFVCFGYAFTLIFNRGED